MRTKAYLITYDYRSKSLGNINNKRSTVIIETEKDGKYNYVDVYPAAYAPLACKEIADMAIGGRNHIPFCTETGIGAAVLNSIGMSQTFSLSLSSGYEIYASAGSLALTLEEITEECLSLINEYYHYKLRVSYSQGIKTILKRIHAAIDIFGPSRVAVDFIANTKSNEPVDYQILKEIDSLGLLWIEEPFPYYYSGKSYANFNTPIIAGEWATSAEELNPITEYTKTLQFDPSMLDLWEISQIKYPYTLTAIHAWGSSLAYELAKKAYAITNLQSNLVFIERPIIKSELEDHIEDGQVDREWLEFASKREPVRFNI